MSEPARGEQTRPKRRRRLDGQLRLAGFGVCLGLAGAAAWLGPLRTLGPSYPGHFMPWWLIFGLCFGISFYYVELRFHRHSVTLALTEIPVVLGLFFVSPTTVLACFVSGVALAHWARRGLRPWKDFANACLDVATLAVAFGTFHLVGPDPHDIFATRSLVALVAASFCSGVVFAPIALNIGIWLLEGEIDLAEAARTAIFQIAVTVTNSCVAVVGLLFVVDKPSLSFVLIPPVALVLVGQLSSTQSQRRAARVEFLYRCSEILHSSRSVEAVGHELLAELIRVFGVEGAELIILPETTPGVALHLRPDQQPLARELSQAEGDTLRDLRLVQPVVQLNGAAAPSVRRLLADRGAHSGAAALLRGLERTLGMIILTNPGASNRQLSRQEQTLLQTLAGQISSALEAGELAAAVHAISEEKDELEQRALHDPLTRLPNRSLFQDRLGQAVQRSSRTGKAIAVVFVDLDGFKPVNDTFGHVVGDILLCAVAERLRRVLRSQDTAARFGGDEFALLLEDLIVSEDAEAVAGRVVEIIREPLVLPEGIIEIRASVGVAIRDSHSPLSAQDLFHRADLAMYEAKRAGKDRYLVAAGDDPQGPLLPAAAG